MAELREVFEMATKQVEPDLDSWRDQERRQQQTRRRRRVGALAVAAAIGLIAVVVILANRPGADTSTPADQPTVYPVDPQAEELASGFVEAFGAFDGERAITYLSDYPDLEMDASSPEEVPVFTSLLEASGYEQILVDPCRVTGTSVNGTAVRCPFDWHGIRSDEIGLGPYPGRWDLTVRDGEIVSAAWLLRYEERFSPEMWEPFADWVSSTHPNDFDVMYVDERASSFALTDESIRLWEKRTKEYVREVQRGNV